MKSPAILLLTALSMCTLGLAAGDDQPPANRPQSNVPPVLRNNDNVEDSVVVTLPGGPEKSATAEKDKEKPAAATTEAATASPSNPTATVTPWPAGDAAKPAESATATQPATEAAPPAEAAAAPAASPDPAPTSPVLAKGVLPDALRAEIALYLRDYIGKWKESDARDLIGTPTSERDATDESAKVNGHVLAFADPTGRYDQLELDFDKHSGQLRTVFAYPKNMTWTQCHHMWAGKVNASLAKKGRRFYSYVDRKLDVLVDPSGTVISLGWY